jgi:hypothetical protein
LVVIVTDSALDGAALDAALELAVVLVDGAAAWVELLGVLLLLPHAAMARPIIPTSGRSPALATVMRPPQLVVVLRC